jgi:Raf kinase inhibitor-like YbhB/YbcL family protein
MRTRRALLAATTAFALPLAGCTGDDGEDDAGDGGGVDDEGGLSLSSSAFDDEGTIPTKYTCDGADVSPPLAVEASDDAAALALLVDDPDAPGDESFVHWLLWNVPPDTTEIPEDVPDRERVDALGSAAQGTNDFDDVGYGGPCPPEGDGPHTYRFTLHALGSELDVEPGAGRDTLAPALGGHSLGAVTLTGEYERE